MNVTKSAKLDEPRPRRVVVGPTRSEHNMFNIHNVDTVLQLLAPLWYPEV